MKRELRPSRALCLLCAPVSPWRIVFLRKIGAVMRFFEHGRAAVFYKQGIAGDFCVKIVLDFVSGRVGFLVKGAQRARGEAVCGEGASFAARRLFFAIDGA